ncbi:MAG: SAM-dependent methyltransferase, partial [Psychrosphaera sp.]|nr:SAM-dependent methyltransferase [Psychrosphaera sp.]
FTNDPYGRTLWGTPPLGCADYAFQQHIQKSLDLGNGRSISLWPHGVLFRDAEAAMRRQMIEQDLVECVIGLGPNLFYNSPMEACLLITKTNKTKSRQGKVLIINAVKEVRQDKNISFLEQNHIDKIFGAYTTFKDQDSFAVLVDTKTILDKNANLAINLYIRPDLLTNNTSVSVASAFQQWQQSSANLQQSMDELFKVLAQ